MPQIQAINIKKAIAEQRHAKAFSLLAMENMRDAEKPLRIHYTWRLDALRDARECQILSAEASARARMHMGIEESTHTE